jgi:16S rRNA (cytosine1402-N4)-methyltransferase
MFKILTKKPITPGDEEIKSNPSSRSAKLRVLKALR